MIDPNFGLRPKSDVEWLLPNVRFATESTHSSWLSAFPLVTLAHMALRFPALMAVDAGLIYSKAIIPECD